MIITVTLNPSIDRTISLPRLQRGVINRGRLLRQDPGGKGVNVSRALRALGVPSLLTGFYGGPMGAMLRDGLLAEGYDVRLIETTGETRQTIALRDESNGRYTKINESGEPPGSAEWLALESLLERKAGPGDLVAFCGSLPSGAHSDSYARLITLAQNKGALALLDSSGPALGEGCRAGPFGLKPNRAELQELLGVRIQRRSELRQAIASLKQQGIHLVAVTLGAAGLCLAWQGQVVAARLPPLEARSPVGAGDAAMAGILWGLAEGAGPEEIARRAAACGAAAAMQEGTGLGERALVERLLGEVRVRRFRPA